MRHDIQIAGYAFRLRPVSKSDAPYIVDLRLRAGKYLNQGARSAAQQAEWLERYFARPDDYYFVIESSDRVPHGLVGIYGVEPAGFDAEWGRWVLEAGSNAAIESALLVYRCAFERLGLQRVHCCTLKENVKAVAFHDSCGLARTARDIVIEHDGRPAPAVEHVLVREAADQVLARLSLLASRFATSARRSRRVQP